MPHRTRKFDPKGFPFPFSAWTEIFPRPTQRTRSTTVVDTPTIDPPQPTPTPPPATTTATPVNTPALPPTTTTAQGTPTLTPSPTTTSSVPRLESNDEATSGPDGSDVASSTPAQGHQASPSPGLSTITTNPSNGTTGTPGFTTKPLLSTSLGTDIFGATPTVSPSPSPHNSNIGAAVGGIIGGLIFLIFLITALLLYLRKRRNRKAPSAEFMDFFRRHGSLLSTYRFKRSSRQSSMFNSLRSEDGGSPTSEKGDLGEDDFEADRLSAQTRVTYGLAV